jgi:hypothetical protein
VVLYAHWTAIDYDIFYFESDGSTPLVIQGAPDSYDIEHSFTIPNPASRV